MSLAINEFICDRNTLIKAIRTAEEKTHSQKGSSFKIILHEKAYSPREIDKLIAQEMFESVDVDENVTSFIRIIQKQPQNDVGYDNPKPGKKDGSNKPLDTRNEFNEVGKRHPIITQKMVDEAIFHVLITNKMSYEDIIKPSFNTDTYFPPFLEITTPDFKTLAAETGEYMTWEDIRLLIKKHKIQGIGTASFSYYLDSIKEDYKHYGENGELVFAQKLYDGLKQDYIEKRRLPSDDVIHEKTGYTPAQIQKAFSPHSTSLIGWRFHMGYEKDLVEREKITSTQKYMYALKQGLIRLPHDLSEFMDIACGFTSNARLTCTYIEAQSRSNDFEYTLEDDEPPITDNEVETILQSFRDRPRNQPLKSLDIG